MVRIDSSRIDYSQTQSDGIDLRFYDAGDHGIELYYEIEEWNELGDSIVWVRVPKIDAAARDYIWMYWGATGPTSHADAGQVWSEYELVYHFAGLSGSTVDNPVGVNGTANGTAGTPIQSAKIGNGFRTLHSATAADKQYVNTNYRSASVPTEWTIEVWVKGDASPVDGANINGPIAGHTYYNIQWDHNNNPGGLVYRDTSGWKTSLSLGGTSLAPNTWYYLSGTYSSADQVVIGYRDGLEVGRDTGLSDTLSATTTDVFVGTEANTNNVMNGLIDELRIANVTRSPDWIAAQYLSMTDTFLEFSAAEEHQP